jgi:hypothetical protein
MFQSIQNFIQEGETWGHGKKIIVNYTRSHWLVSVRPNIIKKSNLGLGL